MSNFPIGPIWDASLGWQAFDFSDLGSIKAKITPPFYKGDATEYTSGDYSDHRLVGAADLSVRDGSVSFYVSCRAAIRITFWGYLGINDSYTVDVNGVEKFYYLNGTDNAAIDDQQTLAFEDGASTENCCNHYFITISGTTLGDDASSFYLNCTIDEVYTQAEYDAL